MNTNPTSNERKKSKLDVKTKQKIICVALTILVFCGIFYLVRSGWTCLENTFLGGAVESPIDTVVALALSVSLLFNLSHWIDKD